MRCIKIFSRVLSKNMGTPVAINSGEHMASGKAEPGLVKL